MGQLKSQLTGAGLLVQTFFVESYSKGLGHSTIIESEPVVAQVWYFEQSAGSIRTLNYKLMQINKNNGI
jgi:hypothetical protein